VLTDGGFALPNLVPPPGFRDENRSVMKLPTPMYVVAERFVESAYTHEILFRPSEFPALYMLAEMYSMQPNSKISKYIEEKFDECLEAMKDVNVVYEAALDIDGNAPAMKILQKIIANRIKEVDWNDAIVKCGDLSFWSGIVERLRSSSATINEYHYLATSGIITSLVTSFVNITQSIELEQVKLLAMPDDVTTIFDGLCYVFLKENIIKITSLCRVVSIVSSAHSVCPVKLLGSIHCEVTICEIFCRKATHSEIMHLKQVLSSELWNHLSEKITKRKWDMFDKLQEKNKDLRKIIGKSDRFFRKCKLGTLSTITVSEARPAYCRGEYVLRGWYENGPVYMNKTAYDVADGGSRAPPLRHRVVIFRNVVNTEMSTEEEESSISKTRNRWYKKIRSEHRKLP
jgi:hypothetical protein